MVGEITKLLGELRCMWKRMETYEICRQASVCGDIPSVYAMRAEGNNICISAAYLIDLAKMAIERRRLY